MSIIKDGTGTKIAAKVDINNRLTTSTISLSAFDSAVICRGAGYFISTNVIALTSGNESGILYLKNNESESLFIDLSLVHWGNALDACCVKIAGGNYKTRSYFNPTGGTLITCGTTIPATNVNLASENTLDACLLAGAEGLTIIAPGFAEDIVGDSGRYCFTTHISVPKGASIAISFIPPVGTSAVEVVFQTFVYKIQEL